MPRVAVEHLAIEGGGMSAAAETAAVIVAARPMTAAEVEVRKGELVAAIDGGETKVRSLLFEQSTGHVSAGDVRAAKQHVEALKEELVDLESLGSVIREKARDRQDERKVAAFTETMEAVAALLKERRALVTEASEATEAAMRAVARHRELTTRIVTLANASAEHSAAACGHHRNSLLAGFHTYTSNIAAQAVSHQLANAQFRLDTNSSLVAITDDAREQSCAGGLLAALARLAPAGWEG